MDGSPGTRSYVERNAASRQRLEAVVQSARRVSAENRAAIGSTLAHIAFWDRFVEARWRLAERLGRPEPPEIDDANTDLVNEAAFPQWRLIPFDDAARDALETAARLDALIEAIELSVVQRLMEGGRPRLVDRSAHRDEHLADLRRSDE
jgi:hypothetical protein